MMNRKDLLIEVYTEELPPGCVIEFNQQLPEMFVKVLKKYRVDYKKVETYLTPVRIIILTIGVSELTNKEVVEIIGPPEKIAIKDGQFTQAALGFAKKFDVEIKDLFIKETQDGKFLCVRKVYGGENFKNLIPDILAETLSQLRYRKTMVWEDTRFNFPRPIRNLLILYGNEIIKTKFASLTSSNFTYGLKTYPLKKIKICPTKKISLIEEYFQILKNEFIIYDIKKRTEILIKSIENLIARKKIKYDKDTQLLNEIVAITEYPSCVLCEFPSDFLKLPKEFIIICMKTKQKFIPLYDENGNLTNMFIGVKNGPSEYLEYVREGFQKVLIARLNDVKYYYEMDKKIDFSLYFEKLKYVVYNDKLKSSYYNKVLRILELSKFLNRKFNFCNEEHITVAAKLIKNDLVTQIVYEYPELQGVAGRIYSKEYCKNNNLPEEISMCCEGHLKPKDYNDILPQDNLSIILALADKVSTVIDNVLIDNLPTGSSDPLGIKKIADGVIKICKEKKIDINFLELFKFYITLLNFNIDNDDKAFFNKFLSFFTARFENVLLLEGYNIDEIKTVLFNFNGEFYTKWLIISAIKSYREKTEFAKFIELYKRIYNILQQGRKKMLLTETKGVVNKQLFQKIEEKRLYEKLLEVKQQIESLYKEKKFVEIINTILHLKPEIDMFFDTVLVFDNNTDIAKNRLRLLEELLEIFVNIGAFHLIQG